MRAAMVALAGAALVAALGCGKKDAAPKGEGSAAKAGGSGQGEGTPPAGPGLTVVHSVGEFSGTYDKAFGKLASGDDPTTLAFVRGCPALACADNVFEIESIGTKCPKAYLALVTLKSDGEPKPGRHDREVTFASSGASSGAGPGAKASTVTLDKVRFEITDIGPDGIAGTASQKTTESSVSGTFKAEICGRQ
jgi:hypothetical protein